MSAFFAYLARIIIILIGFSLATLTAALFFVAVGILPLGVNVADPVWDIAITALFTAIIVASFAGMLTAIPFFILAIISEVQGAKGLLFHCSMGAILGGGATLVWQFGPTNQNEGHLALVGAASGIVGAAVYWLIAGRKAGKLFEAIMVARNQN